MSRPKKQLLIDFILIAISILFAILIAQSTIVFDLLKYLSIFKYLTIFIAGIFFTSVFTTAPALVILGEISRVESFLLVSLIGGLGAVVGDFILFKLFKDRIYYDIRYLFKHSKINRISHIFKTGIFYWFTPLIGAIIIASPLPDELALAFLGFMRIRSSTLIIISFVFNSIGIYIIGLASYYLI